MADLLYPGRRPRPFRVGLRFDALRRARATRAALALARRSPGLPRRRPRPRAARTTRRSTPARRATLRDLFELVKGRPGHRGARRRQEACPYAHELWLPLVLDLRRQARPSACRSRRTSTASTSRSASCRSKWDLFFNGAERKPPSELQTQVEALIRRYANSEIRNNGERFRYQGLSARYTTFNELWQKRLRAREEGKAFGRARPRAEQLPPPRRAAAPSARRPRPRGRAARGEFRVARRRARRRRGARALRPLRRGAAARRRGAAPAFESFQRPHRQADRAHPGREGRPGRRLPARDARTARCRSRPGW